MWHKLPNVGDAVSFVVKQVGDTTATDSLCFADASGDCVYVPKAIALMRLRECGGFASGDESEIDYNKVIGATLTFSKLAPSSVGGRPRWMISRYATPPKREDLAETATVLTSHSIHAEPPMIANAEPVAHTEKREYINAVYEEALVTALAIQKRAFKGKLAPKVTAESVAASAATLFIQYERNRCL